ncbi:M15 family metallopeptidase [Paenibacillus barcinonensis]|uniref:D-Ala-D-Ala carboxypeptidase n=1 Tax=Paenibacillus barcinonensis TaxID=198119 RepID=A0A2V4UX17_PAEBA|nr:M15 family metallopeptidase [Paenibacillus barcinonensis]PYE43809.1 D-Ala-D-Ala carboxypeptidase [Paenibacillus barcinonensis]QKS58401.1 M15 family metallopeptidase [Paenibacillus barcinonensis]
MKKWGFLIGIILIGYIIAQAPAFLVEDKGMPIVILNKDDKYAGYQAISGQKMQEQIHKGNLVLVNSKHAIQPEGVRSDIVYVAGEAELSQGYGLMDQKLMLSREVAERFQRMVEAAGAEDVRYFLMSSGYRDFEKQDELYRQKGSDYALPAGYSEHNLGLSLDVGSSLAAMSEAPEGAWLEKNAWKYGFILRYPKDKVNVTGIQYEPWHFRYVGMPHSAVMAKNGMVLEEYLEMLKAKKNVTVNLDGETYHIHYYQVSKDTRIYLPVNEPYDISGDNMEGVIVTVKKSL